MEDQVSSDISDIVQISKTDLVTRGVAVDLLQLANRVGAQCEAAEYEDLAREKNLLPANIVVDDRWSHRAFRRRHSGTLNESTNVGVKTSRSRVGGPELCVLESKVTGDRDTMFTQVRALLMEVIPYFLLDCL